MLKSQDSACEARMLSSDRKSRTETFINSFKNCGVHNSGGVDECKDCNVLQRLWALYGDLGGHHLGGDLINPLFIHIYFILHSYNTVLVLDSNRLEKLPSITIDVDRPGPCTARLLGPNRFCD